MRNLPVLYCRVPARSVLTAMDMRISTFSWWRRLAWVPALCLWLAGSALAQEASDPPGRVATLSLAQGSVVFAPDGEDSWVELPLNRPLTRGDRVWTDRGGRAELHMGTATVHLDSEAHLAFFELNDSATQLSITQGTINARVRELARGENFEIDTPNLALRALQAGDYRVDVDHARGTTRVQVRAGQAVVYGERGESLRLGAGQQAVFEGRDLEQASARAPATDEFGYWAMERNRREDQSASARYIPRQVVGYQQLDAYGSWASDVTYGTVWYPSVTLANWAPYRYGRWSYIRPWGWTWVDEAPWGFAPFHYGRWALIGSRWAWVPGQFGPRPVYAPALVAFVGGGSGVNVAIQIGTSPGIAWYPLAPGEPWVPLYRASSTYLGHANRGVASFPSGGFVHLHRSRPEALTALRMDDFHSGRPVRDHWKSVHPSEAARAPLTHSLPRPAERERAQQPGGIRQLQAAPAPAARPVTPGPQPPSMLGGHPDEPDDAVHEQYRALREQWRLQRDAEREAWRQQREAERARQPQPVMPRQQVQPLRQGASAPAGVRQIEAEPQRLRRY